MKVKAAKLAYIIYHMKIKDDDAIQSMTDIATARDKILAFAKKIAWETWKNWVNKKFFKKNEEIMRKGFEDWWKQYIEKS